MGFKISVIMGIYNCENTLAESIESLLAQTYPDWQLIMCDDGSTDGTYQVASSYQEQHPEKIILIQNETNKGLNYTLNRCAQFATGEYIARQDGDDISLPMRFEKEVAILEQRDEIALVSTEIIYFTDSGDWGRCNVVASPEKKDFIFGTPFCHAPCMIRKTAFDHVGGYSEGKFLLRAEDYHLWFKLYAVGYRGINIQEPLYKMRDDQHALARRKFHHRFNGTYVRLVGYRMFKFPWRYYPLAFRPLLVGLLPKWLYRKLHGRKLNSTTFLEKK